MDANAQPLIGIDPDDTMEVRVGGAVFVIGVVDAGLWARLEDELALAHERAKRRVIKRLAADGVDPESIVFTSPEKDASGKPKVTLTALEFGAQNDPDFGVEHIRICSDAARLAVRGHSGFQRRDGTAVPYATEEVAMEGQKVRVVATETMRWYRANKRILYELWPAIRRMQLLGPIEKKDSRPAPSATG